MAELVDAQDLKSCWDNISVPVRFRLRALALAFVPRIDSRFNSKVTLANYLFRFEKFYFVERIILFSVPENIKNYYNEVEC